MNKNLIKTVIFLIALTFVTLQSCEKKEIAKTNVKNTDELFFKNDMSKTDNDISWRLWRKSRNCFGGIGICFIEKAKNASKSTDSFSRDNVIVPVSDNDKFVIFQFSQDVSDFNSDSLKFYIDENLELALDNKTLTVYKGTYEFNAAIGEYGGYKIPIIFQ